jgi:phage tail protein X
MDVSMSKWAALAVLGVTFGGGSLAGFALRGSCAPGPALAAPSDLPPPIEGGVDLPSPRAAPAPSVRSVPTPGAWYRVGTGDTLSEVSQKAYGTSRRVADLVQANPGLDPRRLPTGTLVYVPKGSESPGSTSSGRTGLSGRTGAGR